MREDFLMSQGISLENSNDKGGRNNFTAEELGRFHPNQVTKVNPASTRMSTHCMPLWGALGEHGCTSVVFQPQIHKLGRSTRKH